MSTKDSTYLVVVDHNQAHPEHHASPQEAGSHVVQDTLCGISPARFGIVKDATWPTDGPLCETCAQASGVS
ncbi:hypothetical protein [Mumia sp. DW29H23]|uniref:hypothetical protein n=1 Tax=Mumia sp. DW29H23 TaxID=3421241 RepID=UPI003D689983